jgi:hypothetical protein
MKTICPILSILFCFLLLLNFKPGYSSKTDSIQIVIDNQQPILPGESFRIGIIAWHKNGKIKKTTGIAGGNSFWWRYKVEVIGGTDFAGQVKVNGRLVPSKGKYIQISAWPRRQPEKITKKLVPLNYESKISFVPEKPFDKAPGCRIEGKLICEFNDGTTRVYDHLNRKKEAENFVFQPTGGYWDRGSFTINPDFTKIQGHTAALYIRSLRNPAVADTFPVLLDYKHHYQLSFRGRGGMNGFSGTSGSRGSTGSDGGDGQNGQDGEPGENGPDIGVWADLYHDSILHVNLLYVYAENLWNGEPYRYLINPEGGGLEVRSDGGSGGSGGSGGNGGEGGNGENGRVWTEYRTETKTMRKPFKEKKIKKEKKTIVNSEGKPEEIEVEVEVEEEVWKDVQEQVIVEIKHQEPGEDGGDGGWGAAGGLGGTGGYGGNIFLHFADDALQYRHLFAAYSNGGTGGSHGSGGHGGNGGTGGNGNPNGSNGRKGQDGPSAFGWAFDGYDGEVQVLPTEEFFFYTPANP